MREILFKAKRLDNGEWVEGYEIAWENGGFTLFNCDCGFAGEDVIVTGNIHDHDKEKKA